MTPTSECRAFTGHHWPVQIIFVPNEHAWDAVMVELEVGHDYLQTPGRVTTVGRPGHQSVILVQLGDACDDSDWAVVVGVMAHEAVHVLQSVEDEIGGPLGDEPQAYFIQALMMWLIAEYRRAGRGWKVDE